MMTADGRIRKYFQKRKRFLQCEGKYTEQVWVVLTLVPSGLSPAVRMSADHINVQMTALETLFSSKSPCL